MVKRLSDAEIFYLLAEKLQNEWWELLDEEDYMAKGLYISFFTFNDDFMNKVYLETKGLNDEEYNSKVL